MFDSLDVRGLDKCSAESAERYRQQATAVQAATEEARMKHSWKWANDDRHATCAQCGMRMQIVRGPQGGARALYVYPDGTMIGKRSMPPCKRQQRRRG